MIKHCGNNNNLIPLSDLTNSEQTEIQKKGAIASVIARKRKKAIKDAYLLFGELPPAPIVANLFTQSGVNVQKNDSLVDCVLKLMQIKFFSPDTKLADLIKWMDHYIKTTGQDIVEHEPERRFIDVPEAREPVQIVITKHVDENNG